MSGLLPFFMSLSQSGASSPGQALLAPVDANDLLLIALSGQSNAAGHPVVAQSESVPAIYEDGLTSRQFNFPVIWQDYIYNAGAFGPDVALMETLDAAYPGQIRLLKYAVGGTRLRLNTTIIGDPGYRDDWNINSTDELHDKSIADSHNPGIAQLK